MKCTNCNFREGRDNIPLYWAIKHLPVLKGGASSSMLKNGGKTH